MYAWDWSGNLATQIKYDNFIDVSYLVHIYYQLRMCVTYVQKWGTVKKSEQAAHKTLFNVVE